MDEENRRPLVREVHPAKTWPAWLALLLSLLALIVAWMAYNRTGDDLESRINQQVNEAIDKVQNQP